MRFLHLVPLFLTVSLLTLAACSKSSSGPQIPSEPAKAVFQQGVRGESGTGIAEGKSKIISLSNGAKIVVQKRGGILFHAVEGTLSETAFTSIAAAVANLPEDERARVMDQEIDKLLGELKKFAVIGMKKYPQVGYFTFLMPYTQDGVLDQLKSVEFSHELLLSPVVNDPSVMENIKAMTPSAEGLVPRNGARGSTKAFSGLERIKAPEFVKLAESEIGAGAKVDGSSVNLGITDTGITFNHRTFLAQDRKTTRIVYMKDFTREGRVYFSPSAKFEVKPVEGSQNELTVDASIIATPRLPSIPAGDDFKALKPITIKVGPELRAILLSPDKKAMFGALLESSLSSRSDGGQQNDINGNGQANDLLPMILVPGEKVEDSKLYVDLTGTGDFTNVQPIGDWNQTHQMLNAFAEKIGFDIADDELPIKDGTQKTAVKSAALVGFDPDNHGSHVAGIAAGRKTIANDDEDTLARGVAPAAKILMNRVCSVNAGCNATEAFIDLALNGGAEVINMSLGGLNPFNDGYGVEETLINRLTSLKSVLFVVSAGNSGPGKQTVGSPSTARLSLSVGASATKGLIQRQYQWPGAGSTKAEDLDADFMLFFSSRGPTAAGGFKPNVAAPGTELSSVQLNSMPGARGGLDVYWGTSMAAPTATGAYALFLDAVKKFNAAHPDKALPTDAVTLREVIIQSARPFDMNSFNPETGEHSAGQYTWIDEGMGMIDLVSAWKKLAEVRDSKLAVSEDDVPVALEYNVIVPMKNPSGLAYDGSRVALSADPSSKTAAVPAFGTGLYLDPNGTETLRSVYIQRKLPESVESGPEAGEMTRRLLDTKDEFVLKTMIYGSDKVWVKPGTGDELNCWNSDTANLVVLGRGVDIMPREDGTAAINPFYASVLNVCINREVIANELEPGDHGALIFGYRVVNGKTAAIPSFTVPVSVTVPHKTLARANAYEINAKVSSFGVSRNYVFIPAGTSVVQITLEVPQLKLTDAGIPVSGENCSGVELMALKGGNSSPLFATRAEARISNCDAKGSPVTRLKNRKIVFSEMNPTPGMWDLHVFGQYAYVQSSFKLRVDYVNSSSSLSKIEGDTSALNGKLVWTVNSASMETKPAQEQSTFAVDSLLSTLKSELKTGESRPLDGPNGALRTYPEETKQVTITTGGSIGNDIDMIVMECTIPAQQGANPDCSPIGASAGPTDQESVSFAPKAGFGYVAMVTGYSMQNGNEFETTETITLDSEPGKLEISGGDSKFDIGFSLPQQQLETGKLATSDQFKSGKYQITGAIVLKMSNGTVLTKIPVEVSAPKQP